MRFGVNAFTCRQEAELVWCSLYLILLEDRCVASEDVCIYLVSDLGWETIEEEALILRREWDA